MRIRVEVDGAHGRLDDGGVDAGLDLLGDADGDALHAPGDGSCPLLDLGAVLSVDHGDNISSSSSRSLV